MANLELEKYIIDARGKGMSDNTIRQQLLSAGWSVADIDAILSPVSIPTPQSMDSKSLGDADKRIIGVSQKHNYLSLVIFFGVVLGLNILIGYQDAAFSSKTFVIGMFVIAILLTGVFAFVSFLIRKVKGRFGLLWAVLSWVFVCLIPIGAVGIIFWQQSKPSPNISAFQEKDFYQPIPQEWKTYINEPFDLSLKYPSSMKLSESPSAFGFDDVFGVSLEQNISSSTGIGVTIFATKDNKKCDDLLVNASYLSKSIFSHKKDINGTEFSIGSAPLWTASGPIFQEFVYFQHSPICKVAIVAYTTSDLSAYENNLKNIEIKSIQQARDTMTDAAKDILSKVDYTSTLQIGESIIGSMSLDIKDSGSADTTRVNESESVAGDQMTRISGARGAAFRVYNYNSDNSRKSTPSYVGTCEDMAFKSINPDMTCRESKDSFIMYYKWNDKYGYACGDAVSYGFVTVEPKGFYCGGNVSAAPAVVVKKGTSVNGKYSHVGVSNLAAIKDCGILAYKDNKEQSEGIGASDCFNKAISSCQPGVISGVVEGFISTYQLLGKEGGQCILTQRFFKQVSSMETQSAFQKCVINPTVGWSSLSGCVDAE